jgi:hypothetical protein
VIFEYETCADWSGTVASDTLLGPMNRKMAKPLIEPVLSTSAYPTAVEWIPSPSKDASHWG